MEENRVLRSTRDRIPTQVFTPSKTNITVKNYILNEKKVVKKLIDATERDIDVHFEYKHDNIVLEFTPAAYLHFAECIQAHFSNHDTVHVKIFERKDKMGKIVETSINPSTTTDISITAGRTNVDICPKCNRKCLSKCIECSVGNHWIHFNCEKLNKEQINTLEESPDVPYVCTIYTKNSQETASMSRYTSLPPPNNYKSITSDGIGETQLAQQSQQNNTINCPSVTLAESLLLEEVNIRSGNMTKNSNPSINRITKPYVEIKNR
ncbi:unnamed protein product [Mytilus coruscus]|uniref:Uncharacterized protein n=1 Tax=Mytilus coruscus TaxID=42192 RepID=A0A6J7ZTS5_MYTCO|nr:unnamed protein product [Mytilus coruscus]